MAIEEAEDIFGATAILQLAVLGVLAYLAYKLYSLFSQSNCGPNQNQPCCHFSDINTAACVDSSGNSCGWSQFLSGGCFESSAGAAAVTQARQQSSVAGGILTYVAPDTTLGAPTPGLPQGYDPTTGMIGSGGSGPLPPGTPTPQPAPVINTDPFAVLGPMDYLQSIPNM